MQQARQNPTDHMRLACIMLPQVAATGHVWDTATRVQVILLAGRAHLFLGVLV